MGIHGKLIALTGTGREQVAHIVLGIKFCLVSTTLQLLNLTSQNFGTIQEMILRQRKSSGLLTKAPTGFVVKAIAVKRGYLQKFILAEVAQSVQARSLCQG